MSALALALAAALGAAAQDGEAARRYFHEEPRRPFFVLDRATGLYEARRPGATARSFAAAKAAGTFRVFLVGGSIAQNYAEGEDLAAALPAALPGRTIEVVNCGMAGYDGVREELVLREVLGYAPDAVVLLTGHNESTRLPWLPAWRAVLSRWAPARPAPPEPWGPERLALHARRLSAFEAAARRMARAAAAAGVPLVILDPPVNLRDGTARMHLPGDARFRAGWERFLRGDCPGARADWAAASLEEPAERAHAAFLTARCLEREGAARAAKAAFERAYGEERLLLGRCGPPCREALERVAREEGAAFARARAEFDAAAGALPPGLDFFDDLVHWRREANGLVSRAILDALASHPRLASLPWTASRPARRAPPPRRGEGWLMVLRYAAVEMSAEPEALSVPAWAFLARAVEREPRLFSDPESLIARLEAGTAARVWGQPALRVPREAFRRHLDAARRAAGGGR